MGCWNVRTDPAFADPAFELHGDPADRILVATARERDAVLATADERLVEYGKAGFMRVLDVG